ncbi:MAG: hypothetical protein FWH46_02845 [Methanimicrococcus sp.]|nr:hypothetical protein [Methanimicrococcus sp.]
MAELNEISEIVLNEIPVILFVFGLIIVTILIAFFITRLAVRMILRLMERGKIGNAELFNEFLSLKFKVGFYILMIAGGAVLVIVLMTIMSTVRWFYEMGEMIGPAELILILFVLGLIIVTILIAYFILRLAVRMELKRKNE